MGKFGKYPRIVGNGIRNNERITTNKKARNTELSVDIGVISTWITQNTTNLGDRDIYKNTSTKKRIEKKNKKNNSGVVGK